MFLFLHITPALTSQSLAPPPVLPRSGPVGAVCARECVGPGRGPSEAAYGRDELRGPEQWSRQGLSGRCSTGGSAAGGQGKLKKMGQQIKNVKSVNLQVSLKSTFFFFCFSWFSPVLPLSQVLSTPPQCFVVLPPPHLLWSLHVLARCCLSWPSGATLKQWPWVRNRNPSFHHTNKTTIIMRWEEMYLFCHLMLHQQETTPVCVWTGNHSPHGLAASIWTEDLTLALETAKR